MHSWEDCLWQQIYRTLETARLQLVLQVISCLHAAKFMDTDSPSIAATLGRLGALLECGGLKASTIKMLIMDEADKLYDENLQDQTE